MKTYMSLVMDLDAASLHRHTTAALDASLQTDPLTLHDLFEPVVATSETHIGAHHLGDRNILLNDDTRVYLSPRQREILALLAEGMSNKEIAKILDLAEGTVKSYRKTLYQKLQVCRRSQAVACSRTIVGQIVQKFK